MRQGSKGFSIPWYNRKKAEREIIDLAKLSSENPNPVGRVSIDGKILYGNKAFKKKLKERNIRVGDNAPEPIYNVVKDIVKKKSSKPETIDIRMGDQIFEAVIAPIKGLSYVNIYGRDITDRKNAELRIKEGYIKLKKTLNDTIKTLALIVETRDPYTSGHQKRVAIIASCISKEMGLDKDKIKAINIAALIHDIGKINIPASILARPGELSEIEFSMIKTHPRIGFDILKNISFPWNIPKIILQHHEREDGSGYPSGLKGDSILLEAKILAVSDVVEAMSSHRPYRPTLGISEALVEINKNSGKLYDRKVVKICSKIFKEGKIKLIKNNHDNKQKYF